MNKYLELEKLKENVLVCIDNLIKYAEDTKEEVENFYKVLKSELNKDETKDQKKTK
jgi:hypothetical protein